MTRSITTATAKINTTAIGHMIGPPSLKYSINEICMHGKFHSALFNMKSNGTR